MRKPVMLSAVVLAAGSLVVSVAPAAAVDPGLQKVPTKELRDAVTVNGILGHLRALQRIANANDGTRASGTPGYLASAQYVQRQLLAAGYSVELQEFTFPYFEEVTPTALAQTSPEETDYDAIALEYSGNGAPEAVAETAGLGCDAADFSAFTDGGIAVLQRGTCTFLVKAQNAEAAGATGVVIYNAGVEDVEEPLNGTLGEPGIGIPVVGLPSGVGEELAAAVDADETTLAISVDTLLEDRTTYNVLADSPTGDPSKTVVVGAHLDSVLEGPGINDNGSGTATILEIAEQMSALGITNRQKVRFAFWGAEESGLLGAHHYVDSLSDDDLSDIYANLNFDMVGSPNYVPFVYDGDGSSTDTAGPPGSAQLETLFTDYLGTRGGSEPTAFDGRSDYGPFIEVGIPAGGLFSGAEGVKTEEEATKYGGTAGEAYDPCYHQACDTTANLSTTSLAVLGDAAAHATLTLARSKTGLYEDLSRTLNSAPAEEPLGVDAA